jgi:hypothetical protein
MLEEDFDHLLAEATFVELSSCPACGSEDTHPDFEKMGLKYVGCSQCQTSFANPRPTKEDLDRFYEESEAIKFWNSALVKKTEEARRQYIIGPRASWVLELASTYEKGEGVLVDFYTKYPGYIMEIVRRGHFKEVLLRKPMLSGQEISQIVGSKAARSLSPGSVSVVTAFETLERLFDPRAFLEHIFEVLEPSGIAFLTTISISGFDLSLLRDKARSLLAPTHLTLLSDIGIERIMSRSGFDIIELSTPGRLDVALVRDALEREPHLELPPIIRSILDRSERVRAAFQDFLQQANLSSHVWVAVQKRSA